MSAKCQKRTSGHPYSITSSASASTSGGISWPSTLAVLRLTPSEPIGRGGSRAPIADTGLYGLASMIILKGVSAARPTVVKPPLRMTSRSLASPACAPKAVPTSCEREVGTQTIVDAA
jgi:hypothetical protein